MTAPCYEIEMRLRMRGRAYKPICDLPTGRRTDLMFISDIFGI